jgi:hypothetical protein
MLTQHRQIEEMLQQAGWRVAERHVGPEWVDQKAHERSCTNGRPYRLEHTDFIEPPLNVAKNLWCLACAYSQVGGQGA